MNRGTNSKKDCAFLDNLRELIQENLDNPLFGVGELADAIPIHRSSLAKKLKKLSGETPTQWIVRARMECACDLLLSTELPVSRIALQVGFEELSNFSRAFKRFFGVSPSKIRKNGGIGKDVYEKATN